MYWEHRMIKADNEQNCVLTWTGWVQKDVLFLHRCWTCPILNSHLPSMSFGCLILSMASKTSTPVTCQIMRTDTRAPRTSALWYLSSWWKELSKNKINFDSPSDARCRLDKAQSVWNQKAFCLRRKGKDDTIGYCSCLWIQFWDKLYIYVGPLHTYKVYWYSFSWWSRPHHVCMLPIQITIFKGIIAQGTIQVVCWNLETPGNSVKHQFWQNCGLHTTGGAAFVAQWAGNKDLAWAFALPAAWNLLETFDQIVPKDWEFWVDFPVCSLWLLESGAEMYLEHPIAVHFLALF